MYGSLSHFLEVFFRNFRKYYKNINIFSLPGNSREYIYIDIDKNLSKLYIVKISISFKI